MRLGLCGLAVLFCLAAKATLASGLDACETALHDETTDEIGYIVREPDPLTDVMFDFYLEGCKLFVEGAGAVDVLLKTGTFSLTSRFFPGGMPPSEPSITEAFDATLFGNLAELQDAGGGAIDVLGSPEFWHLALTPRSGSAVFPGGLSLTFDRATGGSGPIYLLIWDWDVDPPEVIGLEFQNGRVTLAAIPLPGPASLLAAAIGLLAFLGRGLRRRTARGGCC